LRLNSERLHKFADLSSVEGFLDELATREPVRVVKLPRAPGEREARWAHLLCGEVALPPAAPAGLAGPAMAAATAGAWGTDVSAGELAALKAEQARMAAELAQLKALVQRLCGELGIESAVP
ncbi:MAG: DUF480 domain-containing protein, partial [Rubrivivax sp.]